MSKYKRESLKRIPKLTVISIASNNNPPISLQCRAVNSSAADVKTRPACDSYFIFMIRFRHDLEQGLHRDWSPLASEVRCDAPDPWDPWESVIFTPVSLKFQPFFMNSKTMRRVSYLTQFMYVWVQAVLNGANPIFEMKMKTCNAQAFTKVTKQMTVEENSSSSTMAAKITAGALIASLKSMTTI